jgi:NAD-dependent dihydropyrimidine dehydrogenase PreA subunit
LDEHAQINPQECIDCGVCQGECPVSAIIEE